MKIFERKFTFSKPVTRARKLGVKLFPYYEFNLEMNRFFYYEEEDGYWIESDERHYSDAFWKDSKGATAFGLINLVGEDKFKLIEGGNRKFTKGVYTYKELSLTEYGV